MSCRDCSESLTDPPCFVLDAEEGFWEAGFVTVVHPITALASLRHRRAVTAVGWLVELLVTSSEKWGSRPRDSIPLSLSLLLSLSLSLSF